VIAFTRHLASPTTPNRVMWFTGSLDPNGDAGGPILITESFTGSWQTYAEALTDANVSWRVCDDNPTTNYNVLQDFSNFKNAQAGSVLHDSGVATSPTSKFTASTAVRVSSSLSGQSGVRTR
jgi:phospholipase C